MSKWRLARVSGINKETHEELHRLYEGKEFNVKPLTPNSSLYKVEGSEYWLLESWLIFIDEQDSTEQEVEQDVSYELDHLGQRFIDKSHALAKCYPDSWSVISETAKYHMHTLNVGDIELIFTVNKEINTHRIQTMNKKGAQFANLVWASDEDTREFKAFKDVIALLSKKGMRI